MVKPRDDTEHIFRSTQQCLHLLAMTLNNKL
nr:hypothetical protein [Rickettsia bellii]